MGNRQRTEPSDLHQSPRMHWDPSIGNPPPHWIQPPCRLVGLANNDIANPSWGNNIWTVPDKFFHRHQEYADARRGGTLQEINNHVH